jgi:hypothetical protein
MRSAISVTLHCDGGHADDGLLGKPFLKLVISRLALDETEPPAVTVDHNRDMVRIVESLRTTIEGGVIGQRPRRRRTTQDFYRSRALREYCRSLSFLCRSCDGRCPCVNHGRGLADSYVSARHGSNLWSSACFCSSLSFHLAVTPPWQGGAQRTICTAEVLSHARRLRVTRKCL